MAYTKEKQDLYNKDYYAKNKKKIQERHKQRRIRVAQEKILIQERNLECFSALPFKFLIEFDF